MRQTDTGQTNDGAGAGLPSPNIVPLVPLSGGPGAAGYVQQPVMMNTRPGQPAQIYTGSAAPGGGVIEQRSRGNVAPVAMMPAPGGVVNTRSGPAPVAPMGMGGNVRQRPAEVYGAPGTLRNFVQWRNPRGDPVVPHDLTHMAINLANARYHGGGDK